MPAFTIPPIMRAAQCTDFSDNADSVLSVQDDIATPRLDVDKPPSGFKNAMLVKVFAVALAPGDVRAMSGKTREFQGPPSFPYIPGGDLCGIVEQVSEEKDKKGNSICKFNVGDRIAARFVNKPMGMLGEYALVSPDVCDRVPDSISSEGAAALVSSGTCALLIADKIKEGDRVLIFGAGGGVGSHLCQLARLQGASYVAGVGIDSQRLTEKPLSVDHAVDYTKTDPFSVKEWQNDPFDVVIDLASGVWPGLINQESRKIKSMIVKPASKGGRFLTITVDKPSFEIHSLWGIIMPFILIPLWRAIYTRVGISRLSLPKYTQIMALPGSNNVVTRTMALASEGKLYPSIDPQGPFPFSTEGVQDMHSGYKKVVMPKERWS